MLSGWLLCCCVTSAVVCEVPVFRYALERWPADTCELVVFHQGLTEDQERFLLELETASTAQGGPANIRVTRAETSDSLDESVAELWKSLPAASRRTPYAVLRTSLGRGRSIRHWEGTLDQARSAKLLHSPARQELRRRLLQGHAIVWLMLKSPDDQRNAATRRQLEPRFEQLSSTIELPEGVGLPGSELYAEVPLLLKFSLLELDPKDAREQVLVRLIAGTQPEAFQAGQPLLVPVFGRARALEVIPANRLNSALTRDLTAFLCGACSCVVKDRNPGFDLLLSAQWDRELFGEDGETPPDRTQLEGRNRPPVLLPIPPGRKK